MNAYTFIWLELFRKNIGLLLNPILYRKFTCCSDDSFPMADILSILKVNKVIFYISILNNSQKKNPFWNIFSQCVFTDRYAMHLTLLFSQIRIWGSDPDFETYLSLCVFMDRYALCTQMHKSGFENRIRILKHIFPRVSLRTGMQCT